MSIIKSFSVGNGDMFYIEHGSSNFSIIDCFLTDENENKEKIIKEVKDKSKKKDIVRFISTHPDEDHIDGIGDLFAEVSIPNFYCVKNEATKPDESSSFKKYCELRDSDKAFFIEKGVSRKWMNIGDDERGSSGINILWPDVSNEHYKKELQNAKEGTSFNNMSAIIKYSIKDGATALWMGDIETEFLDSVSNEIDFEQVDILFAPHHGRKTGKIPSRILKILNPKVIIIGEAPSEHINYLNGYETLKQNTAKDIIFDCSDSDIHVHVSNEEYGELFLVDKGMPDIDENHTYIGSIEL